jgi:hypothetical protein
MEFIIFTYNAKDIKEYNLSISLMHEITLQNKTKRLKTIPENTFLTKK